MKYSQIDNTLFIKNRKKNAKHFYDLFKDCKNANIIEFDSESSHFAFVIILKKDIRNIF